MSANDFDGRPFIAGSMVGVRCFRVDGFGRLRAVMRSFHPPFAPGENVAECARTPMDILSGFTFQLTSSGLEARKREQPAEHHVGCLGCSCGFYAYYDDDYNPYRDMDGVVEAVVEGYGTVTTGSRGFRAEKARLVALVEPRKSRHGWSMDGLARRVGDHHAGIWANVIGTISFTVGIGWAVTAVQSSPWYAFAFALPIIGLLLLYLAFRSIYVEDEPDEEHLAVERWELVRRNYPDVPVYKSRADALSAHPLTVPLLPSPESDPDFWTRAS